MNSQISTQEKTEKKPTVMIVDDEELVLESLRSFLSLESDYELLTYESPVEALKVLNNRAVDIVISDFLMPGMNGLQFLKEVKKLYPDVPRVLLTGYADKENAIRSINEVGLYQYIEKPWDNENIRLIIRNGVQSKNLNEALREKIRELDQVLLHRDELAQRDDLIRKELSLARKLQDNILPTTPLCYGDIAIHSKYKPALEIGGDFFDIIRLNHKQIAIFLADVTGHGIQAALSAMLLKFAFSSFMDKDICAMDILTGMNKLLHQILPVDIFVAGMVVTIDIEPRNGSYHGAIVNGGIPHPFIVHQKSGEVEQIPANGLILGAVDENLYEPGEEHEFALGKEDVLILYTDGLSESQDQDGKHFDDGSLSKTLSRHSGLPLPALLDKLVAESEKFKKDDDALDDITLVGIGTNLK